MVQAQNKRTCCLSFPSGGSFQPLVCLKGFHTATQHSPVQREGPLRPRGGGGQTGRGLRWGSVRAAVLAGWRHEGACRSLCPGNPKRPPHRGGDGKENTRNSLPYWVLLVVPFFKFYFSMIVDIQYYISFRFTT